MVLFLHFDCNELVTFVYLYSWPITAGKKEPVSYPQQDPVGVENKRTETVIFFLTIFLFNFLRPQ